MECSEDRGIECQGLCFNYVDGNVTLTVYKNLPGITRELAGTIFQRSFSISEWEEINGYLRETLDEAEGVFDDRDGDEKEEEGDEPDISSDDNEVVVPMVVSSLPAMSGTVPEAAGDDKEENGKE